MDPAAAASIPILAGLSPKARKQVLKFARERTFAPGDVVVRQGDPALHLYIVASGTARVERDGESWSGRLRAGDFFGELGIIEDHGRTATVLAEDELTCFMLPAWEFRALLKEHPEMALPMLYAVIGRLHRREHHTG